ncbi:formate/nitrite transporter family protein [Pinibacter soli]|uniref:Formate/nitrite transporter family protein n=1 Tax=Pinibacter soli TaxID=3044211 RepID=A0ABT6RG20_9BACT|nr:formate/nitrite transporter family protein [Pinibacter soli]MDI3321518.1 formate/nitrite transporter family protein [Pinibacter soli]
MDLGYNTPAQVVDYVVETGHKKSTLPTTKMLFLGIMAGVFLSLAAHATIIVTHNIPYLGFARLISGLIFPVGLVLILLSGSELFTGNTLIMVSCLQKKASWKNYAKSLFFVYIGNLIGSLLVVVCLYCYNHDCHTDNLISAYNIKVAATKSSMTPSAALISSTFANLLVCMGVWFCYTAKDVAGKIMGIFYPIFLFIVLGLEHVIANMYYIPMGLLAKTNPAYLQAAKDMGVSAEKLCNLNLSNAIINNIIPATIGNLVGGALMVGAFYWWMFFKNEQKSVKSKHDCY